MLSHDFAVPSVPRDVQIFSEVIVWGPPADCYQLRFSGSFTRTVNKLPSESYHAVTDDNIRNFGSNIQVSVSNIIQYIYLQNSNQLLQVRARTSAGPGPYSFLIPYTGDVIIHKVDKVKVIIHDSQESMRTTMPIYRLYVPCDFI